MNPLTAGVGAIVLKLASPVELVISMAITLIGAAHFKGSSQPSEQQRRTLQHLENPMLSDRERAFYTKQFYAFDTTPVDKCLPPAA